MTKRTARRKRQGKTGGIDRGVISAYFKKQRHAMNYRLMLEKTADLLINLAVASVAVSAFQGVWYGIVMALFSYLLALLICARLGGNS